MDSGEFDVEQAVGLLRSAAAAMRSVTTSPTDEVRAIHVAVNALQAREADLLAAIDETRAHEAEGAASVSTWAVRELGQDVSLTRQLVKASATMRDLPTIREAARAGLASQAHVNALTYGLKHVGEQTRELEQDLTQVAVAASPRDLFTVIKAVRDVVYEDELDEAWLRGMEKEDFQCVKVGDGYQPKGFFGIDLGAMIKVYLDAVSAPRDADDTRTAAQRRIDAFHELITSALDGLPASGGIRPNVNVIIDADKLKNTLNSGVVSRPLRGTSTTGCSLNSTVVEVATQSPSKPLDHTPTILEGFGPIGPALLKYLVCGGELTPILVTGIKENYRVLDVGRTQRLATGKQRRAIRLRQQGRCANRGCHHPIGEVHHIIDWAYGGKTNLSNLVGLCRKCHCLVTMGRLTMTGTWDTGYTFTTSRAGPLSRTGGA